MEPGEASDRAALLGIIDHEVELLPAPYREAVVLCDLEGRCGTPRPRAGSVARWGRSRAGWLGAGHGSATGW